MAVNYSNNESSQSDLVETISSDDEEPIAESTVRSVISEFSIENYGANTVFDKGNVGSQPQTSTPNTRRAIKWKRSISKPKNGESTHENEL